MTDTQDKVMTLKASISPGYRWRLLAVAVVCLGFAGWSAYDGFVAYPRLNRHAKEFEQYKLDHEDWVSSWEAYADQHGLPHEPERPKSNFSIIAQYVQMGITLPIGLIFGYGYLSSGGRWVGLDDNALTTSRDESVPFDAIRQLNKDRWKNKGIAVVHYDRGEGERKIILDDWKFDRTATGQLLRAVEAKIDHQLIVGSDPEPQSDTDDAAAAPPPPDTGSSKATS